ncbi:KN motif and ankyrin repeat domain-containing protein 4 [Phycodurus eques]|uniref:KN motif and ankyrin repeat domain-containing protein 4 n=1 Tax=Phycodurus eques TaxID=693459 RepID=UPI002ACEC9AA|nr:KN motif and ankyrin repeat domain-containing protein 4 [Phycodurus eques]XP_061540358.1 KN motif and ankyrin repeat domain-containing protein 4 [Phycodurus eques]XP_061540359.1 KN motif and ankyrin repeat domain-containing protein 4 [Phycodurus eques]XP_061540361.1 KN motif and ankyrin repeat domain-containing protein 4 [Phycodurus eques]
MMDKKSANGFQTTASEGGVQRKQLPYSVETPYGFHLDLDFLKYVDDIEKGNTIKRVHIQRRIKGPPKFSTLPRNFSLPGHVIRPAPKDSLWTGISTLGPTPKSRLTEVPQISDLRANEGGTSCQGTAIQPTSVFSARLRGDGILGAQGIEEKITGTKNRPNLLRASSMPITLQQRKGSDSSSPDRIVGTPENGSTENMFRASPDITERRCVTQERVGIHQQITVALKRVRELEEQVKTIPELKAQICSLRLEREQLLCQLQAQEKAQTSTLSSKMAPCADVRIETQPQASREGFNLFLTPQLNEHLTRKAVTEEKKQGSPEAIIMLQKEAVNQGLIKSFCQQESNIQTQLLEKCDQHKETVGSPLEHAGQEDGNATMGDNFGDSRSVHNLHEKLVILEAKLLKASQELERTNDLLKEQIVENQVKEEKILQLSEGIRVEVCPSETHCRPRRESIDTGTETERVDYANQETETQSPGTVDQGTDTERICIVCIPVPQSGCIDQETETTKVDSQDKVTEVGAEGFLVSAQLPVVNSMEQGTVTERAKTKDQMTETTVTKSEGETDHPQRSRASSVDRGTETERMHTMDRVTETEVAQMNDQHTETDVERVQDHIPVRNAETESHEIENTGNQRDEVYIRVSESEEGKKINEGIQKDHRDEVITDMSVSVQISGIKKETVASHFVNPTEESRSSRVVIEEHAETTPEVSLVQKNSETKAILLLESVETQHVSRSAGESLGTVTVVVASESATVKTGVPVRPQRGHRPSSDQSQPTPQLQAAPVSPRRGSSEIQGQQSKTDSQSSAELSNRQLKHESPSQSQSGDKTAVISCEESKLQPQTEIQSPSSSAKEVQTRPKSIQAPSKTTTRQDSKEIKAPTRVSSVSQPLRRRSGDGHTHPRRQASVEIQSPSRSLSEESQPLKKEPEQQTLCRGVSETAQHQSSAEALTSRRNIDEAQQVRRDSSESPTSPAALGQVVTRITGLLGEQWAQLGSSSGVQPLVSQQQNPSTQKQTPGKSTEAGKGASAKPAGKAATTGKPAGKPGPSKMSSIQSQLVSSLSVLSAFYSQGQKAAANKQQEQGLKSIMKKNGVADKQGNKGTKKNLKFVGVNGGYESTSSDESSGDEEAKVDIGGEGGSSQAEEEKDKEPASAEKPEEGADAQAKDAEILPSEEAAVAAEKESSEDLLDSKGSHGLLGEEAEGEKVDKSFIDACLYVKDRMEEVTSPDKEMRQVLVVLYQEWFKVSSQKTSQADTVRLYLRQVGLTTPTLLPYVVNLTDGNGNMALHYSVSHSNFPVVKLLLDTGLCETDNVNKAGYTPVMLAALTAAESPDDLEVAQQLLRLGDVNARSRQMGQTALMLAVSHGRLAMVKLLLTCGADVNAQDYEGSTALMCASEHGHTHIARLLLETGHCDTSLTDKNGQTAKEVAEGSSHPDVADLIAAHGKAECGR